MLFELIQPIKEVLERCTVAGGQAYIVGDTVRELMSGVCPHCWEIATTVKPARIMERFGQGLLVDGARGTIEIEWDGVRCKIAPCRAEGAYSAYLEENKYKPAANIMDDLSCRDFTVNAMAYDGKVLFDPFGGQRDLAAGVLRCVGIPDKKFEEDPLRILRLYRFASLLGYTTEWETFCAANDKMKLVASLNKEEVLDELRMILLSPEPQVLSPMIAKGGLARYGFYFAPALGALREVPSNLLCRCWALIALCGADTKKVSKALGFCDEFIADLQTCTRLYRLGPANDKVDLKQKLYNTKLDYAPVAATFAALSPSFMGEPVLFAAIHIKKEPYRLQDLAVDGAMLSFEGIRGESCTKVMDELLGVVIKNPALNRTQILLGLAKGLGEIV